MNTTDEIKERGAHFTPPDVAYFIAKTTYGLLEHASALVSVLDPSCGDGELLVAALSYLHEKGHQVRLIGVETDERTLKIARDRLQPLLLDDDQLHLHLTDFLSCRSEDDDLMLVDTVGRLIANPPYVRTQVLGSEVAQALSKRYKLTGKTDLYHAFFLNYRRFLKETGAIGVITSNRYLYTKSGEQVRKHLHEQYTMDLIADLGDTKIFSAAVLPALLFAIPGCNEKHEVRCVRIYEKDSSCKHSISCNNVVEMIENDESGYYSIKDKIHRVDWGHVRDTAFAKDPWVLASEKQEKWLDAVNAASSCCISDVAKVRVGIKTTADNVFIKDDWGCLPSDMMPEHQYIHPLISSKDASRWVLDGKPSLSILYPHEIGDNGKRCVVPLEGHPGLESYLLSHYEQLHGRNYVIRAKRHWYEIWVPQDPSAWEKPKIVFPDISSSAKFLLDLNGCLVDGNCYWIQPIDQDDENLLYLILGVANSSLMNTYHSLAFQNVLYSGKRRYLTQYVDRYPLPNVNCEPARKLIEYVKCCVGEGISCDQSTVDTMVFESFGVAEFVEE